jgi:hypothetical protein
MHEEIAPFWSCDDHPHVRSKYENVPEMKGNEGKRCSFVGQDGAKCQTRAHAKGKCSKHGASRCKVEGCLKHYVLRGLCTAHFKLNFPQEIETLRKRQGVGKPRKSKKKKSSTTVTEEH